MSEVLAERYSRLMELYPEGYRAARGEEILATLLECARPGQRWPSVRETAGLIAGAVQTRLAHSSPSYRAWWYGAVHLAVLLLLLPRVYELLTATMGNYHSYEMRYGLAADFPLAVSVWAGCGAVALVAAVLRWYRVALGAVVALSFLELGPFGEPVSLFVLNDALVLNVAWYGVVIGLLAALALRAPGRALRPPPAWIAVVLTIVLVAPPYAPYMITRMDVLFGLGVLLSLLLGLFDLRVPAAVGLYLLGSGAFTVAVSAMTGTQAAPDIAWQIGATLVSAALLAGASLAGQRIVVRL